MPDALPISLPSGISIAKTRHVGPAAEAKGGFQERLQAPVSLAQPHLVRVLARETDRLDRVRPRVQ